MQKILVVDDEPAIITLLTYNLEKAGYEVIAVQDGKEALTKVSSVNPDLMLLDLMLPGLEGIEVLKQLRQERNQVPVIMLTARGDELDKILGLELGADDYITKPFSPREVLARVKALLRRVQTKPEPYNESTWLTVGELSLDPDSYQANLGDKALELTTKEFELLLYLLRNKGRVVTRDQLLDQVWNYEYVGDTRIVDVHISHLREKIEADSKNPKYIKTIRGVGYRLEEPIA